MIKFLSLLGVAIIALFVSMFSHGCNMQVIDTTWNYNIAYVRGLGQDEWKRVEIVSWKDFGDSDMVQIKTKSGKSYCTHSTNIILAIE